MRQLQVGSRFGRFSAAVSVAVSAVLVFALVACGTDDNSPRAAVERFLASVAEHDLEGAAAQTDNPGEAQEALAGAWAGLAAEGVETESGAVQVNGDTAEIDVTYRWALPRDQQWEYSASVRLGRTDAGWSVRWSSTNIHPDLGATQRFSLQFTDAPRATVNEADGSEVLVDGTNIGITFDAAVAAQEGAVGDSVTRLVQALAEFDPNLSEQRIAEESTATQGPYPIMRISQQDYDRLADALAIPGVDHNRQVELVAADPLFAPALLDEVRKVVGDEVTGGSGWRVVTVNPNGLDADVLADHPAEPAPAISLSLSRTVQNAAQSAVNAAGAFQTAMVVIQPSTGRVLAVAQNPAADRDGPIATMGLYPPGSTFKIITAAAAISQNLAHPDTQVGCPGSIDIGPRSIPNYNGFALGTVSLLQAFAASCNTTFAELASKMGPSDLPNAAAAMGIGQQYTIPGLAVQSGSVPIANETVARSEDGFGQGKVLVSPFSLALAAGTVAAGGTTPVPQLILGKETRVDGPQPHLTQGVVDELRPMMRAVVADGTAEVIAGQGEVFGKTGEAEFADGSHAWFAGYRGDLAFATLVVRGGDSNNAVGVTRDFFAGLPPGFGM